MRIEIEKDQTSNLVLQLKVDDTTFQVPITTNSKIEISIVDKKDQQCSFRSGPQFPTFEELEKTYSKELQILSDRGYNRRPRCCLRLLSRFDGDVEKVIAFIDEKRKRFGCHQDRDVEQQQQPSPVEVPVPSSPAVPESTDAEKSERCGRWAAWREKIAKLKETYATQLEQLSQMGFEDTRVNLRLLKEFEGDLGRVLEELLSGKDLRRGWCGLFEDPEKLKALEVEYAAQLAFLKQHGFDHLRRNLMVLKKNDGNQDAALKWLQEGGPCGGKWKQLKEEYASQLDELTKRGFDNPRWRLRSLMKFNGDVELASEWLKTHHQPKNDC